MRSFRRGQKKYDPVGTDTLYDPVAFSEAAASHPQFQAGSTPKSSPMLPYNEYTPPPVLTLVHSMNTTSSTKLVSSPKKLLTPIRNLFHSSSSTNVSHQKSPSITSANDSLNNALYRTPPTKGHRKTPSLSSVGFNHRGHKRNTLSMGSSKTFEDETKPQSFRLKHLNSQPNLRDYELLNETFQSPIAYEKTETGVLLPLAVVIKNLPPTLQQTVNARTSIQSSSQASLMSQTASAHSTETFSSLSRKLPESLNSTLGLHHTVASKRSLSEFGNHKSMKLQPPVELKYVKEVNEDRTFNESDVVSLATSEEFQMKPTTVDKCTSPETNRVDYDIGDSEVDELDSDSDTSQFSFVRDMRKGRNVSVKYYKSKVPKEKEAPTVFSPVDLGYEEDYLDYDFENNGMENFDSEIGDEEEDVMYNNILDDENPKATTTFETLSPIKEQIDLESDEPFSDDFQFDEVKKSHFLEKPPLKKGQNSSTCQSSFLSPSSCKKISASQHNKLSHTSHLSLQGFKSILIDPIEHEDCNTDEILESYFDGSYLPSIMNFSDSQNLDQNSPGSTKREAGSPLVNGLTIGTNLRHRLAKNEEASLTDDTLYNKRNNFFIHRESLEHLNDSSDVDTTVFERRMLRSFHSSISDNFEQIVAQKVNEHEKFVSGLKCENSTSEELVTLKHVESSSSVTGDLDHSRFGLGISTPLDKDNSQSLNDLGSSMTKNRNSINEMMGILQGLGGELSNKLKRQSIHDMMDILKNVDTLENLDLTHHERNSIVNMMDLLQKAEDAQGPSNLSNTQRNSIAGMMSLLGGLESDSESRSTKTNNTNRNSVNDMMGLLGKLDETLAVKEPIEASKRGKPLSLNLSKKISNKLDPTATLMDLSPSPQEEHRRSLAIDDNLDTWDDGMLDEINQIPEDFEFEDYVLKGQYNPRSAPGFLKSKSYYYRPSRNIVETKFQKNKIETGNKTVTFYRSSSPLMLDISRSKSVSRAPSTRSTNSFISMQEDSLVKEEDEENQSTVILDESSSPLNQSVESDANNLKNHLITITEASPRIN